MAGFIQKAFEDILKCLGLESSGEKSVGGDEDVVINPSPQPNATYESLPSTDATDPLVEVLSSPMTLITINDDAVKTNGGTIGEATYKEPKIIVSTRAISSGGGGKHN